MEPAPEVLARVAEIASDHRSGADTLARKAAEALQLQAGAPSADGTKLREALAEAARRLVAAQPAMASIFNLANAVLFAIEGVEDLSALRSLVTSACRGFTAKIAEAHEAISQAARAHIPDGGTVLTHSFSSTVAAALFAAWRSGRRFSVICTESRPLCEGVTLARTLAAARIPVTVIADAAVHHHFRKASVALSGADAVAREGVLNKAGTALMALSARAHRKQFLVLAGTHKWLPPGRKMAWERPEDPREILSEDIAGVGVSNVYFDLTPLRLVTAVISEQGAFPPAAVRRRLGELELHPAFTGGHAGSVA
jgi:ribose 1,5-bisphosphate isomerase